MVPHGDLGDWRVVAGEPNASPDFDKSYPRCDTSGSRAPISELGRGLAMAYRDDCVRALPWSLIGASLPPTARHLRLPAFLQRRHRCVRSSSSSL
jgi:hypothetical protein